MTKQAPEIFQLPLASLDMAGLPPSNDPGFEQAVIAHYALQYGIKGWNAAVVVSEGQVRVVAVPQQGVEPKAYLLGLLRHGYIEDALPGLQAMYGMVDDPDICFNFGVALSELGRVEESLVPLNKCLRLDPSYDNAAIAIGVSLSKLGRYDEAEVVLKAATKVQPDNPLIKQNLAATLARAGKFPEALPYFRQAASLAPDSPVALMGLANCLNSIEGHEKESLTVYKEVVKRFPDSQFTESAKRILNKAGQSDLRKVVDDGLRPDAVEYMIGAIKRFAEMPQEQVGRAVMEIAKLGETGLEINNPRKRYSLTNLEGDFSGLQLLCYMHVGMAIFDPTMDSGSGLQREFELWISTEVLALRPTPSTSARCCWKRNEESGSRNRRSSPRGSRKRSEPSSAQWSFAFLPKSKVGLRTCCLRRKATNRRQYCTDCVSSVRLRFCIFAVAKLPLSVVDTHT